MEDVNFKKTVRFTEAVRRLLSGRYVIRSRNPKAFQSIVDNEGQLMDYFDLAGGDLHINDMLGVAYVSSNSEDDENCQIRFGRKVTLKASETLALIFIRRQRAEYFDSANAEAESPLLDIEKLKSAMALVMKKDEATDKDFQREFGKTLDRLKELQILMGDEHDSLVISPVADIVLPADEIQTYAQAAEKYFTAKDFFED
ncbi:MAG: DUF4194 domain-containing protein [Calothrix sp. SM1_5_4]|nr:DUF4194 domain-containing protein [Calothrix sp. SM1_5_4]